MEDFYEDDFYEDWTEEEEEEAGRRLDERMDNSHLFDYYDYREGIGLPESRTE